DHHSQNKIQRGTEARIDETVSNAGGCQTMRKNLGIVIQSPMPWKHTKEPTFRNRMEHDRELGHQSDDNYAKRDDPDQNRLASSSWSFSTTGMAPTEHFMASACDRFLADTKKKQSHNKNEHHQRVPHRIRV